MGLLVIAWIGMTPIELRGQKLNPAVASLVAHDMNEVFLRVSNRGNYGAQLNANDVGNFPLGTVNRYLFGTGLWIGGIGDVDGNGEPDTLTTIGYNPSNIQNMEWIEGAVGFSPDDPRFRVLDSTNPQDQAIYPAEPVAPQELFTIYDDRFTIVTGGQTSIPLGVEVRQRSFAYTETALEGAVFFQLDIQNISADIRSFGYTIEDMWVGVALDPDIGPVVGDLSDDTAAPLEIDGQDVLLIWDSDFFEVVWEGRPGFLAVVPLETLGGDVTITQMTSGTSNQVLPVPQTDQTQYSALAAVPPWTPTIAEPGFDLRALIGWGGIDLEPGTLRRTALAFVWADVTGDPPDFLSPQDPDLDQDLPQLTGLVAAVREARTAYTERLAGLAPILDFPGTPPEPGDGDRDELAQNYPNPFSDETTIEYLNGAAGEIRLEVFDLMGRLVKTLVSGNRGEGGFSINWDGQSQTGIEMPAGVYVIRLKTERGEQTVRALKVP